MKIGHHSSRFDRTGSHFENAAELVAANCSLCTFTEVTHDGNVIPGRDRLVELGWDTWQPDPNNPAGSDESAFGWDLEIWELEARAKKKLSELRYHREGGSLAPFTVAIAGLFHRLGTDERWVIVSVHMPANTTDNDGCNVWWNGAGSGDRGDVFRDAMQNLGPWIQSQREEWERTGATTLIAGDWNQKCECDWFKNKIRDWMPKEFSLSSGPYPDTINVSTYDWWIEGNRVEPLANGTAMSSPASDHKFVVRKYGRTS